MTGAGADMGQLHYVGDDGNAEHNERGDAAGLHGRVRNPSQLPISK